MLTRDILFAFQKKEYETSGKCAGIKDPADFFGLIKCIIGYVLFPARIHCNITIPRPDLRVKR